VWIRLFSRASARAADIPTATGMLPHASNAINRGCALFTTYAPGHSPHDKDGGMSPTARRITATLSVRSAIHDAFSKLECVLRRALH
jgi:hypothetical protein